jgi:hypothetical protein
MKKKKKEKKSKKEKENKLRAMNDSSRGFYLAGNEPLGK